MGGSNSVPVERIAAREICIHNSAAFVVHAEILGCDAFEEASFPVGQEICIDLDDCGGLWEGSDLTAKTTVVASLQSVLGIDDPFLEYGFDYSKFGNKTTINIVGTMNYFDLVLADSVELPLPEINCPDVSEFCYVATRKDIYGGSKVTFAAMEDICKQYGGQIVSIHSEEENAVVADVIATNIPEGEAWIGYDYYVEWYGRIKTQWHWVDETPVNYTNFAPGEPSQGVLCADGSASPCGPQVNAVWESKAIMRTNGEWDDVPAQFNYNGICKQKKEGIRNRLPLN